LVFVLLEFESQPEDQADKGEDAYWENQGSYRFVKRPKSNDEEEESNERRLKDLHANRVCDGGHREVGSELS
jgi:hypothetical protein